MFRLSPSELPIGFVSLGYQGKHVLPGHDWLSQLLHDAVEGD